MAARYFYNKKIKNAPIRRRLDRRFALWMIVAAMVGSAVAAGFVYSARCQFEAISLGYQTQDLREKLEQRLEQQRLLELERERELAPEQLEARARRLGLRRPEFPVGAAVSPRLSGTAQ
jgi:hypothetical protein